MTDINSAKGHFSEVPSQANFPGLEEELLQFWDREKVFERSGHITKVFRCS